MLIRTSASLVLITKDVKLAMKLLAQAANLVFHWTHWLKIVKDATQICVIACNAPIFRHVRLANPMCLIFRTVPANVELITSGRSQTIQANHADVTGISVPTTTNVYLATIGSQVAKPAVLLKMRRTPNWRFSLQPALQINKCHTSSVIIASQESITITIRPCAKNVLKSSLDAIFAIN